MGVTLRDKDLKLDEVQVSHTLGWSGEGGIQGEGSGEKARGFGVTEGKVFKKGALLFL